MKLLDKDKLESKFPFGLDVVSNWDVLFNADWNTLAEASMLLPPRFTITIEEVIRFSDVLIVNTNC